MGRASGGNYPPGQVLVIGASDVLLEDVGVDGYNGIAMSIAGDRIRIVNPAIVNPQPATGGGDANGAGIRVKNGTGFRCDGGTIMAGGDAAIQFSTDTAFAPLGAIVDGAFANVRCTSLSGRLMLVGTNSAEIRNVRFLGISGTSLGDGECIRVQNNPRTGGRAAAPISDVLFRDIAVMQATPNSNAITITNALSDANGTISNIRFETTTIRTPTNVAFAAFSTAGTVSANPLGPIQDVSWRGGGIFALAANAPGISLTNLNGGLFESLQISGGTSEPVVLLGDSGSGYADVGCRNVAFVDVAVSGISAGKTGVKFDKATNCSWARGAIAEASAATPADAAFTLTANARNCAIEGADLSGITTGFKLDPAASYRISAGYVGSNAANGRRTALALGVATAAIGSGTATVASSAVSLKTTAGSTGQTTLNTVNGGVPGDLLVVSWAGMDSSIKASDGGGNLALSADVPLNAAADTLALVQRADGKWLELSQSDNA